VPLFDALEMIYKAADLGEIKEFRLDDAVKMINRAIASESMHVNESTAGKRYAYFVDIEAGKAMSALLRVSGVDWKIEAGMLVFVPLREKMEMREYDVTLAKMDALQFQLAMKTLPLGSDYGYMGNSKHAFGPDMIKIGNVPEIQERVRWVLEQYQAGETTESIREKMLEGIGTALEKKLQQRHSFDFEVPGQTFTALMDRFSSLAGLSIVFDMPVEKYVEKKGFGRVDQVRTCDALPYLLSMNDMDSATFTYRHDAVIIQAKVSEAKLALEVYNTRDITETIDGGQNKEGEARLDQKIKALAPGTWRPEGGATFERTEGVLKVKQTEEVHKKIRDFLKAARKEMDIVEAIDLRLYDVSDIINGKDGKLDPEMAKMLETEIPFKLDEKKGTSIELRGGRLVVMETPTGHAKLDAKLNAMRKELDIPIETKEKR
jgi:hypothetical protein